MSAALTTLTLVVLVVSLKQFESASATETDMSVDQAILSALKSKKNNCRRKFCPGEGYVGQDCRCWCPSSNNATAAELCEEVVKAELDMLFTAEQWNKRHIRSSNERNRSDDKSEMNKLLWQNATVPLDILSGISQPNINKFHMAVKRFHEYSCLRFRPFVESDVDIVEVHDSFNCSSYLGRIGARQKLFFNPHCTTVDKVAEVQRSLEPAKTDGKTIRQRPKRLIPMQLQRLRVLKATNQLRDVLHLLSRVVGVGYEHTRPDRDHYITINESNVDEKSLIYFEKEIIARAYTGVPYDYLSVMHFKAQALSKNGHPTIIAKNASYQEKMGIHKDFSFIDVKRLNMMYKCAERSGCSHSLRCPGEGFVGQDCRCWCRALDDGAPAVHCTAQEQRAEVRLVRAVSGQEHSGLVEVSYRGEWGIVCDDGWDIADARVICHQLGYSNAINASTNLIATSSNFFLDDVACNGTEESIDQCAHRPWKEHNCGPEEAAGVICQSAKAQEQRTEVRIVGAVSGQEHSGMVEVNYKGQWGFVCDDAWDITDARVICRQLGYGEATNALTNLLATSSWNGFFLDDVECNGTEQSIDQCKHLPWKEHNCRPEEAAGVTCQITKAHHLLCGDQSRGPGVLTSPEISESHGNEIRCTWIITALHDRNSLQLRFNNLTMEECCDHLVISDGSGFQYTFSGVRQPHQLKRLHLQSPAMIMFFASKSSAGVRGMFNAIVDEVSGSANGICRSVHWTRWGESCFRVLWFTTGISWYDARFQCRSLGGFLAEIPSSYEQQNMENFLVNQNLTVNEVWIGLKRRQPIGPWRWESGASLTFSNWNGGQPRGASWNETCMSLIYRGMRGWTAANCNEWKVPLCMLQRT